MFLLLGVLGNEGGLSCLIRLFTGGEPEEGREGGREGGRTEVSDRPLLVHANIFISPFPPPLSLSPSLPALHLLHLPSALHHRLLRLPLPGRTPGTSLLVIVLLSCQGHFEGLDLTGGKGKEGKREGGREGRSGSF